MTADYKPRALVVCPGRGTYNKEELGYLNRRHGSRWSQLSFIDDYRNSKGKTPVYTLDGAEKYSIKTHTPGEHASALIYACAFGDFLAIDQQAFDLVAVTGNSMGWYIGASVAGALAPKDAIEVIDTMGSMMADGVVGGQIIYPYVDEQWQEIPGKKDSLLDLISQFHGKDEQELYLSIDLGGYLVFAGNEKGLKAFEQAVPVVDERFPARLYNHGAFHTPLMEDNSSRGFQQLSQVTFQQPNVPLVDGRGHIWTPYSTDVAELKNYTLGHQVTEPYRFDLAVQVAVKEFAPDVIIVLGPGTTLSSSVAHNLIQLQWQGLTSKADFLARQKDDPVVVAMGFEDQAQRVTG